MTLIAIVGSQGTGKSTLIDAVCQADKSVLKVERKASRSVLHELNISLDAINTDPIASMKFQDIILNRKMDDDSSLDNNIWLTERTPIDFFVYTLINLGKLNEYDQFVNDYFDKCVDYTLKYDKIVFLENGKFDPVDDGIRGTNVHYSTMVNLLMTHYYKRAESNGADVTWIDVGDLDLRVKEVRSIIKSLK